MKNGDNYIRKILPEGKRNPYLVYYENFNIKQTEPSQVQPDFEAWMDLTTLGCQNKCSSQDYVGCIRYMVQSVNVEVFIIDQIGISSALRQYLADILSPFFSIDG